MQSNKPKQKLNRKKQSLKRKFIEISKTAQWINGERSYHHEDHETSATAALAGEDLMIMQEFKPGEVHEVRAGPIVA